MAQSHAVGGSIQQTLQQNVDAEPVPLKRKKKDSGTPAEKSVVVLKRSDVTIRNDSVFMPNTIEMAQLKKKEKGQFLTNVQISSKMSKQDIKELLISLFPYLGDQRFYCASAVDNRTRLDFHGERRIWDGLQIKQKIKGNSALYIYTDEGSLAKQDSTSSKQSTLKRPHGQMTPTTQGGCRIDKGASQSQSRKPTMHIADGQAEGRNTIPSKSSSLSHTDLQGMVSSSLTCQLNSLNITSAASEQERGQLGQTAAGGYDLALVPLEATTRQGQGNGAATRVQVIACNSIDQSKRSYVVRAEVDQCAGKSGSESNATDAHQEYSGTSGSDFESPLSDSAVEGPSDSGIEGSDSLFANDTVENICPESGSVKGGIGFYIALTKALPDEVKKGVAVFEGVAAVTVDKTNSFVLSGTVPPSPEAGDVTVTVRTDSGQYIGFTVFTYKDDVKEMVKNIVNDDTLQFKFFKEYARELEKKNLASEGRKTEALGPLHVPHLDSSFETKQKKPLELLQLMVYTAAQTNAQRFIEMVFSTSAGQVVFNYYKDRTPLPEDVARANGYNELAQYLQDVHTRLSLDKNVHSTVIDWLELVEAVQKQSLATHDESPVGLGQSDEDDDNSSDYFADAETSSCGSSDDDTGWPEISESKEPCIHDEISNKVQSIGECDDLLMTGSSKASFTKNERIIKGESTKGQTTRKDICFVVKQGSSCLDKGRETGEYSELPSSLSCFADLLEMSCEDLNNENSISKEPCIHDEISNEVQSIGECDELSRTCSSKASFTKNERIIKGESTKGQITRDETSFVVNQGSSCLDKREEREISELSKPQRITSLPELIVISCEDPGEDNLIISTSRNNMAKQPKEPCIHDVSSNEVLPVEIIVSWCDDLSKTSSKASFTKNEKIVEVESTMRQTTSEDCAFAMKQGFSCLEKGKEKEFSELSWPEKISCLPKLLGMSCEDLNSADIISTESSTGDGIYVETYIKSAVVSDHSPMNKFAIKRSDSNNDRILTSEELNQEPTAKPDEIAMNSKAHMNKEEEDASAAEEGVILDTEGWRPTSERATFCFVDVEILFQHGCSIFDRLMASIFVDEELSATEHLMKAISDAKIKGVWKCFAREFGVSGIITVFDLMLYKYLHMNCNLDGEKLLSLLKLLMKEQHFLEREQLFAMERLLAQKLSTKTEQLLNVRLMKRERKFQGTYEGSGDPVCKSVNSYEGEPKEVALAILFELFLDHVAAQTCLESTVGVRNSKINQTDKENQQIDKNDYKALKLCKAGRGTQATYEAVQTSLDVNDVQLEDLAVGFRCVLQTKPLESNFRKTDEIRVETLIDLSCDLREEWKYLVFALGVGDAKNDRVDERNQTLRKKCYNMLLLWKQRFGPQATYKALEVGLCHDSVQREDLVKKYCHDIISSAMQ